MQQIIVLIHVIICICLLALVLLQQGKGADVGAAFGSGASNTMFGSQGSLPFLLKVTAIFGILFFVTSLSLSYMAGHRSQTSSVLSIPSNAQTKVVKKTVATPAKKQSVVLTFDKPKTSIKKKITKK